MTNETHKLDYAIPAAAALDPDVDCYATGPILVLRTGGVAPDRCVNCNNAENDRLDMTFRPPSRMKRLELALGKLALGIWPIFVLGYIVELFLRRRISLRLAVCSRCRRLYLRRKTVRAVLTVMMIASAIAGVVRLATADRGSEELTTGFIFLLVALVAVVITAKWSTKSLRVVMINGERVFLEGAGKPFLASLSTRW